MILTTHAITAAAIAALFPEYPALGFGFGFASHFLLDMIPHWDYSLKSLHHSEENYLDADMEIGKYFTRDICKIGLDAFLGLGLSWLIFSYFFGISYIPVLLGAIAGMLPDFLQFVYMKLRVEPLISLQKFHHFAHSKISLKGRFILGPILQLFFVIIVVFLFSLRFL